MLDAEICLDRATGACIRIRWDLLGVGGEGECGEEGEAGDEACGDHGGSFEHSS
jgi:hypothetical protein